MRVGGGSPVRARQPRGERVASLLLLVILGAAGILTEAQTFRVVAAGDARDASPADYLAVAALRGERPGQVGVALATIRGDAEEIVVGVCGVEPDRPYRLVIDGVGTATLRPTEGGVVNASLYSAPDATDRTLPEHARPVSRVRRVELVGGEGRLVVSGELVPVTVRAGRSSPREAAAAAFAPRATATP